MADPIQTGFLKKEELLQKGYMLLAQKQYDHAIKHFGQLLSMDPNDSRVLVGMASAYQHKKKPDEAIRYAQRALEIDPAYHYAYDVLAEIYFINKNDYVKAEEYALKSLELYPFDSTTYSLLAQIYYFQKYYPACYEYANNALSIDPLNYVAHMVLGLYYWHIPNYPEAEEHYKACLALAPNNPTVYGNYGLLSMAFSQNKMGYELLKEAVSLNPEDTFLQESFREAYIRNNIFYAPLYWLTGGRFDDVYIIYTNIVLLALLAFIIQLPIIPKVVDVILLGILILNLIMLFVMVIYRFVMRFAINRFYSWHIKIGALHKII